MLLSPFNPIFFTATRSDGRRSDYEQVFAPSDRIMLQAICSEADYGNDGDQMPRFALVDICAGTRTELIPRGVNVNAEDSVLLVCLQNLECSRYRLEVTEVGGTRHTSLPFTVTDDPIDLQDTVLIQYAMRDNRQRRDAVFFFSGIRQFFDLRVHGGFKDGGWNFGADTEQFSTDLSDPVTLYARESLTKTLTMGDSHGCPIWYGDLLNRLLCCDYVYIDGERYARSESSTPEKSQPAETLDSFIFTQALRRIVYMSPTLDTQNRIALRRTGIRWRAADSQLRKL